MKHTEHINTSLARQAIIAKHTIRASRLVERIAKDRAAKRYGNIKSYQASLQATRARILDLEGGCSLFGDNAFRHALMSGRGMV